MTSRFDPPALGTLTRWDAGDLDRAWRMYDGLLRLGNECYHFERANTNCPRCVARLWCHALERELAGRTRWQAVAA